MSFNSQHTAADTRAVTALMREYSRRYLAPASGRREIEHYGVEESRARSIMRYVLGFGTSLATTALVMVDPRHNDAFIDMTADKLTRYGIGARHKNHAADIAAGIIPEPHHAWINGTAPAILALLTAQGYAVRVRTHDGAYSIPAATVTAVAA